MKKTIGKLRAIACVAAMAILALSLTACGTPTTQKEDGTFVVGVCQLTQHVALDAATQGFVDALKDKLGDKVEIVVKNASNDIPTCTTIVNGFVTDGVDLILANATPALQAAAAATDSIPILGTSITDYATALDIDDWTGTTGRNISGSSDLAPLAGQAQIFKEMFPNEKKVGFVYCSGEPNSVYQCSVMKTELEALGYEVETFAFADSNELAAVAQTACDKSDVLYVPTDNTVADNAELLANVAVPAGVPIIAGEEGICSGCGVATLSISYADIGKAAAEMAYEILVNKADVSAMEVRFSDAPAKKYNAALCEKYGITPPEGYEAIG